MLDDPHTTGGQHDCGRGGDIDRFRTVAAGAAGVQSVAVRGTGIKHEHPLANRAHGPQQLVCGLALLAQGSQEVPVWASDA